MRSPSARLSVVAFAIPLLWAWEASASVAGDDPGPTPESNRIAAPGQGGTSAPATSAAGAGAQGDERWHRLIGILQYLEADYPAAIESQSEFELAEQSAFISEAIVAARELGAAVQPVVARLVALQATIEAGEDPEGVSGSCHELIEEIAALGGVVRSPRQAPDLEQGGVLYAEHCASCHAADGSADVAIAAQMEPPPANFLDPELMGGLSPYKAFNTISFGVPGTAMVGFSSLAEHQRWSLAFFLHSMRQPACSAKPTRLSVRDLAALSDDALAAAYGADGLACLRTVLPRVDPAQSLLLAKTEVREALRLAHSGDRSGARVKFLDAYLQGVEPVELLIQAHDRSLVQEIEGVFLGIRFELERGGGDVQAKGEELLRLLDRAEEATVPASITVAFWGAFLIILREGFEAMIVIAALLAVLKRMKQPGYARVVHLGWFSALILGAFGFVFGQRFLARFNPEWVEGVAALLAVAMLLYHTIWLNARAHIADYMKELRSKMEGALGRGSVFGLFAIAFTAVLRESLEVVLFLQGLSADSPEGVAWGSAVGLAALLALVLFVSRVGYKLPMKALFQVSTILLFATAVVLLGKGIHALQIVGAIPVEPLPLFTFDFLGIFPDAISLMAQLLLALSPLGWKVGKRIGSKITAPTPVGQSIK